MTEKEQETENKKATPRETSDRKGNKWQKRIQAAEKKTSARKGNN